MAPPSGSMPGPHPEPPQDVARRKLPIHSSDGPWIRSYGLHYDPLHFGHTGFNRFDAPAQEFGIMYCGCDEEVAFAETFLHDPGSQTRVVAMSDIGKRGRALVEASRPLRLVDLTGEGLSQLGADARLCSGDYSIAQRWSLAFFRHPDRPDGLLYRSRIDPSRLSVAIYDRARQCLTVSALGSLADPAHHAVLARILSTYDVGLLDARP